MKVIIENKKSQQVRIVDLSSLTISQFETMYNIEEWEIIKYIHRY